MIPRFKSIIYFLAITPGLFWSCTPTKTITKITTGIVKYDIELDLTEAGQAMAESFGNSATVWFNPAYLRLQKASEVPNEEFYITNLADGFEKAYIQFKDKKYAVLPDPRQLPETGPIRFLEETKTIAGYVCKKATAKMGAGEMVVYYSNDFGINYCPYLDLEGFALEYTLVMPFGDITYRAKEVQKTEVPNTLINPAADFEEVTYREFQAAMMANVKSSEAVTREGYRFEKVDIKGTPVNLSNYLGQVVVLNFWFTACAPCKAEIPYLNQLVADYSGKEVQFLAITYDPSSKVQPFLNQHPFDFQIIPDAHDVIRDFEIIVYPTTIVLDKSGKIVNTIMGGSPNIAEDIGKMIEAAQNH